MKRARPEQRIRFDLDGPSVGPLSLRSNFSWNVAGNLVNAACQWAMLLVLAKFTSPGMLGAFAVGLAVTSPVIMFSQLQLRGVQATDTRNQYRFAHYLALRLVTTTLAILFLAGFVAIGGYDSHTALVILAVTLFKAFESIADVCYGLMQQHERMDRIARSRIIKGVLSLAALASLVIITRDTLWGVLGMTAVLASILMTYDLRCVQTTLKDSFQALDDANMRPASIKSAISLTDLTRLAWLALPLGLVMGLVSLKTNIPRYFIVAQLGPADLGIFAALSSLIVVGNTFISAMGQACMPRLAKHYADGAQDRYLRLLLRLLGIAVVVGVLGIVAAAFLGRLTLLFFFRPEYAVHAPLFLSLMIYGCLEYAASCLGYGMTAAHRFKEQLPLFALTTAVTALAAWQLVPLLGLRGGVVSLQIGMGFQILGSVTVLSLSFQPKRVIRAIFARVTT